MASIFAFRTRSPDRDRATDKVRFDQLARSLDQLSSEIAAERTGIRKRYEAVSANAAFLVEAMDNSEVSQRRATEMDQLTETLKTCLRRIEALGRQTEFVAELRHVLDTFVDEGRETVEESSASGALEEVRRRL
ncbi:hypothetical protein J1C56_25070 [Aminobacter anthyllidis]|uniref:Uncharacterized protein n=1 Tax=Aminobacter anthyllidis TaxID=1035067 RepID=A0A9X1D882_9HYPH|nr:hypothetical protein [Aminobacter anthyllidis]MBT1158851.1 hypothetical protein [Aminobacter anthyllidis]MDH4987356.1 hypothetical protein [Aminobacter anthyllidis]